MCFSSSSFVYTSNVVVMSIYEFKKYKSLCYFCCCLKKTNFLACVIGFKQSSWTFDEPSRLVREQIFLVKENNRPTEQRFEVRINLGTIAGTISAATKAEDYATQLIDNTIFSALLASEHNITFHLILYPDNIAEGNEGFILTSSPAGEIRYTLPSPGSTVFRYETVVIRDDDRKWY